MNLSIAILAAGQGTRMRSDLPKVLHPLAGRSLLSHAIETAHALDGAAVHVVIGHGAEQVQAQLDASGIHWVEQVEQLGTGHAVQQVMPAVPDDHVVLVMYGDVPLITAETLGSLTAIAATGNVGLLTAVLDDATGYGRILRDADNSISGIVEHKDASEEQRSIKEINTGFLAAPADKLRRWVEALANNNTQGEYYLTDIIGMAVSEGVVVTGIMPADNHEIMGVNTRVQLAELERCFQLRQATQLMDAGVTLTDPARFDVRGSLKTGHDVVIDVNAIFEGDVTLGNGVQIGANAVICDSVIGDDVVVLPNCVIEQAEIGARSRVGPFARIRPEARLAVDTHIGNFVEIKKSEVGAGSKINHLSYIGDTTIGERVNIGAGTITCNYDGANKHRTIIGNDVFIGSDTQLIAPVKVGDGATIGAGSTITRDAPSNELTLSRAPQESRSGWQRPVKKK